MTKLSKECSLKNHEEIGNVKHLAQKYSNLQVDELVLYNIVSSAKNQTVSHKWIRDVSRAINIPFCIAGGIRTLKDAENILNNGADKISINTPALENPQIIDEFVKNFGSQAVVIGIDTKKVDNINIIYKNTGQPNLMSSSKKTLEEWVVEVQERGAGEVVINSINSDGMRNGYDILLLKKLRKDYQNTINSIWWRWHNATFF